MTMISRLKPRLRISICLAEIVKELQEHSATHACSGDVLIVADVDRRWGPVRTVDRRWGHRRYNLVTP